MPDISFFGPDTVPGLDTDLLGAIVNLIGRTGSTSFRLGWVDDEKDIPVIWYAAVQYKGAWETMAAMDPLTAASRLAEQLMDGGTCTHCHRPTGLELDPRHPVSDLRSELPVVDKICWYYYDPAGKRFRRGCEDQKPAPARVDS